jgi:hypothetical protein
MCFRGTSCTDPPRILCTQVSCLKNFLVEFYRFVCENQLHLLNKGRHWVWFSSKRNGWRACCYSLDSVNLHHFCSMVQSRLLWTFQWRIKVNVHAFVFINYGPARKRTCFKVSKGNANCTPLRYNGHNEGFPCMLQVFFQSGIFVFSDFGQWGMILSIS